MAVKVIRPEDHDDDFDIVSKLELDLPLDLRR